MSPLGNLLRSSLGRKLIMPLYLRIPKDIHKYMSASASEERMTLAMFARLTLVNALRTRMTA